MLEKIYVSYWGRYGLKQGNPLQNSQINNQTILYLFSFLWFSFLYKKFIDGKILVYVRENICRSLRKIWPEIGASLAIFLNQ